ncbi:MarR family transcriptional regulator [Heliobacillus mobilis]|uniref:MarR family transcriptional regulator n=1 Tax=Heliobacterium mobile TaxID=28064 RepID=A0A6I3SP13_HELMO|nr:MarR family transcriptional regulator [Heliobacterium mobile]MTV50639.1 MarR family transcriptional regulator [Heliobacterium mobile]
MDRDELLKLDNQLCFTIYACSKEIIRIYRPFLAELGLTYTQYVVLLVLWEKDDINLKELGERLYLDSGTLTPLLKKMEAAGLLFRQRSQEDERHIFIRLTEQGQELKKAAYETLQKAFCNMPISVEEAISLRGQLKTLLNRLPSVHR